MKSIKLRLFVTGQSAYGLEARENLEALTRAYAQYEFDVEVVDVLENPQLAITDKVIATPTLIKHNPLPACRVVGDLSNRARVVRALGLRSDADAPGTSAAG